jgi:hypothetical protein
VSARWAETLQRMYDSEINFSISTFWDGGFDWKLGDEQNGFVKEGSTFTFGEAVECLANAAHTHYQDSVFHLGRLEFERRYKAKLAEEVAKP